MPSEYEEMRFDALSEEEDDALVAAIVDGPLGFFLLEWHWDLERALEMMPTDESGDGPLREIVKEVRDSMGQWVGEFELDRMD